ncbi:hypothetical protein OGR47_14680 [Methylocystis sp. MJC1]|uniref:hypothetical protein n=1 Tax=Methylocystis sp. MJC1 TaxID=2654282 RepID=UPI0013EB803B|nr:hypothetical protein [Methylocystis sp. MJC1]KAF2990413.1 hypothetical protein MJC1_02512 [Methylocystis sp. MJC1]MBU6528208.1 hypothetical protein [Methylocystis sp. MJC1]UZX11117.1 hypothetical protein OGR47_14680 [Methylocystis sp. MJC1]
MTIRLYGNVKNQGLVAHPELGARLNQLAICCRGLEWAIEDFCAGEENDSGRRLSGIASRLAEQSERLARALAAEIGEPLD